MRRLAAVLIAGAIGFGPATGALDLRLIGMHTLSPRSVFAGTRVGGLSGLDYDARTDRWIAVSDDRGEHGVDRCYAVKLDYDEHAVRGAEIVAVVLLQVPAGRRGLDLEAVRIDPRDGSWWFSSEGDAGRGLEPAVLQFHPDGRWRETMPLPGEFRARAEGREGVHPNRNLESITFSPDGSSIWIGLEAPPTVRGVVPTATRGATTTVTQLTRAGEILKTGDYILDPWQRQPAPGGLADNGLAELLTLPDGRLLALERSGAQDAQRRWSFAARVYETLPGGGKRLVYDFGRDSSRQVGNLEGMAWGRRLEHGAATLVVVSDDNFAEDPGAPGTQFWVFEVTFNP